MSDQPSAGARRRLGATAHIYRGRGATCHTLPYVAIYIWHRPIRTEIQSYKNKVSQLTKVLDTALRYSSITINSPTRAINNGGLG